MAIIVANSQLLLQPPPRTVGPRRLQLTSRIAQQIGRSSLPQLNFRSLGGCGDKRRSSGALSVRSSIQTQGTMAKTGNPAEQLLDMWAKEPTIALSANPETEEVRRLFMWDSVPKEEEVQIFSIYEMNQHDRDSPAFLPFSLINIGKLTAFTGVMAAINSIWETLKRGFVHGIGDMVPFSNKLYDSSLTMRLGVTGGLTTVLKSYPGRGPAALKKEKFFSPDRYEAMYTFYLGDLGHVCAQGPFSTFEDSLLTVTGGVGFFLEAKGVIRLHNLTPFKLFYTFHLKGIPQLPCQLTATAVKPDASVQATPEAVACLPGHALPNYTD